VVIAQQSFIRIEGFIFEGTTARSTIHVRNHPRKKATAPVQGIEIVGNHFLSNGSRTNDTRVIYFQSAGHKTFHHTAAPNVISGNTFRGNYGRGISLLASSDTVVSKNTGTDGKGSSRKRDGVYAARFLQIGGEDKAGNNSERNVVEQNTIRDFTVQPYVGSARNEIQAIKLDANADWNVIRENLIFNLDAERHKGSEGIFIESRCDDNVVSGNIVYNVGESCYRDGSRTTTVTRRNRWINNIGYNCECGLALSNAQGATVRNNIFAQNRVAQVYITTTSVANGGHLFSRNLYHKTNHSKLNTWNGPASGCGEATQDFPEWTAASHDTNSLVADPQFANPPADFRLRATSPAREAGVTGTDRSAPQRGENSR
jgi:parallel beta-helix repeat protein